MWSTRISGAVLGGFFLYSCAEHPPNGTGGGAHSSPSTASTSEIDSGTGAPRPFASPLASLDDRCGDTCCLPSSLYSGGRLSPAAGDVAGAKSTLANPNADARSLAFALRIVSSSGEPRDPALFARFVDDARAAGTLPTAHWGQAFQRCYSVAWEPTSPSREALAALGGIYTHRFEDAKDYHGWIASHPDPESSLDVWVARVSSTRPPAKELVATLRAKGPDLFREVMLVACAGGDCGVTDDELVSMIASWGKQHALDWLTLTDKPSWKDDETNAARSTFLKLADRIFDASDVPRLEAYWKQSDPRYPWDRGRLAVMLSRLRPSDAIRYWSDTLPEMNSYGAAPILREAAKRAPVEMEAALARHFFKDPDYSDPHASFVDGASGAEAISSGLAEESDVRGAKVFARLVLRPWKSNEPSAMEALARASLHFGCAGIPEPSTLRPRGMKNMRKDDWDAESARAEGASVALAQAARACAKKLLAK